MSASTKVLIYNGGFTASASTQDLKKLFSEYGIFHRPDIIESNFTSITGLTKSNNPTFIVPGGSAVLMGKVLAPLLMDINAKMPYSNYVGVCAGAFVATSDAHIFMVGKDGVPRFDGSTMSLHVNAGVIPEFKAVGPFYENFNPHRVGLAFNTMEEKELPHLYVDGPGFIPCEDAEGRRLRSSFDVVASYSERPSYSFSYSARSVEFKELPAILRRRRTGEKGGVFVSGPHIEATVKDSHFLRLFKPKKSAERPSLSLADYKLLEENQSKSVATIAALLRETLNTGDELAVRPKSSSCAIL